MKTLWLLGLVWLAGSALAFLGGKSSKGGAAAEPEKPELVTLDTNGLQRILRLKTDRVTTLNAIRDSLNQAMAQFRKSKAIFADKLEQMRSVVDSNLHEFGNQFGGVGDEGKV